VWARAKLRRRRRLLPKAKLLEQALEGTGGMAGPFLYAAKGAKTLRRGIKLPSNLFHIELADWTTAILLLSAFVAAASCKPHYDGGRLVMNQLDPADMSGTTGFKD
jgi:hypothetical protein